MLFELPKILILAMGEGVRGDHFLSSFFSGLRSWQNLFPRWKNWLIFVVEKNSRKFSPRIFGKNELIGENEENYTLMWKIEILVDSFQSFRRYVVQFRLLAKYKAWTNFIEVQIKRKFQPSSNLYKLRYVKKITDNVRC